jgi:uncharacterized membrane protein YfcA
MITARLGAALAHRLEAKTLSQCLELFLVLMGLNMLWKAYKTEPAEGYPAGIVSCA